MLQQFVTASMGEDDMHDISDLSLCCVRQRKSMQPSFNFNRSDIRESVFAPFGADPDIQRCLHGSLRRTRFTGQFVVCVVLDQLKISLCEQVRVN